VLFVKRQATKQGNCDSAENEDDYKSPHDDALTAASFHVPVSANQAKSSADDRPKSDPQAVVDVKLSIDDEDKARCDSRILH